MGHATVLSTLAHGIDLPPPQNESTTELRMLLEFGFLKGETQWNENVIRPSRSYRSFGLPKWICWMPRLDIR